jgi:hypothetical protein
LRGEPIYERGEDDERDDLVGNVVIIAVDGACPIARRE